VAKMIALALLTLDVGQSLTVPLNCWLFCARKRVLRALLVL